MNVCSALRKHATIYYITYIHVEITHLEGGMRRLDGPVGQIGGDAGEGAAGVVLGRKQGRRSGLRRRMLLLLWVWWLWLMLGMV